jgi:hypothetical protein
MVISDFKAWADWVALYPETISFVNIVPPDGFLAGYRVTSRGFPVVQAVIEPLGIVLAGFGVVFAGGAVKRTKEQSYS